MSQFRNDENIDANQSPSREFKEESEIENWYSEFVKAGGLAADQCLCFAYSREAKSRSGKAPRSLRGVRYVTCDYGSQSKMKQEFDSFLQDLDSNKSRSEGKS